MLIVEHVLDGDLADLNVIGEEELVDGLGGVGHEHAPSEGGLLQEVRQRCGVVQVEVRDEQHVHRGRVDLVEVWQSRHP